MSSKNYYKDKIFLKLIIELIFGHWKNEESVEQVFSTVAGASRENTKYYICVTFCGMRSPKSNAVGDKLCTVNSNHDTSVFGK